MLLFTGGRSSNIDSQDEYDDDDEVDLGSPERSRRRRIPLDRLRTMHHDYVNGMGRLLEDYIHLVTRHERLTNVHASTLRELENAKKRIEVLERQMGGGGSGSGSGGGGGAGAGGGGGGGGGGSSASFR